MGDPFSIAGSAVSVISLGIQVCSGLLPYYEAFKSYDSYGIRVYGKLDGLKTTLVTLQESLERLAPTSASAVENTRRKILSCQTGFQVIEQTWKDCQRSSSSDGIRQKVQNVRRRIAFPFKKSTLQDLDALMTDLQLNLDTAILTLAMYLSSKVFNKLERY